MPTPGPEQELPRFLEKGRGETVDQPLVYPDGTACISGPGSYTLFDCDMATVVTGDVVIDEDGVPTYTLLDTFADSYTLPQRRWRERWTLSVNSTTFKYEQEVLLCRSAPVMLLNVNKLYRMHPQWRRQLPQARETLTQGARVRSSPADCVEDAWTELLQRILGDGLLPNQILNWYSASRCHKWMAAAMVCRDFQTDTGMESRWRDLANEYDEKAEKAYEDLKVRVDTDDDGVTSNDNLSSIEPPLYLSNIPYRQNRPNYNDPFFEEG